MKRGVLISALLVYVAVTLGCMLSSSGDPANSGLSYQRQNRHLPPEHAQGLPLRGVAMQLQRVDWIDTEYRKSIDEIAGLGADSVLFVVDAHQENGRSSVIYLDMRMTPTGAQLGSLIDYAKSKKLRVVLMPIVLLDHPINDEWRGKIDPLDWSTWWESYRAMMYHYSIVSQAHNVDVLVVGSELVSTEEKTHDWYKTIDGIRDVYKGMLTYSANWDHFKEVSFWDHLDLIGVNSYYTLGKDASVSVSEIERNWAPYKDNLVRFGRQIDKPILFIEAGWCSQANAASEPWDYTQDNVPIDLELQKKLYEGFFKTWYGDPALGGFMLWEWPPGAGGPNDRGYTPKGKPAENVARDWFAKEKWKVE